MRIVNSPGASGTVLDRYTRKPVQGAECVISRSFQRAWPDYGPPTLDDALETTRPPHVLTDGDGQFLITPEIKWNFDFPPPEGPARGTLIVRKDGYKPTLVPLMEDVSMNLAQILLTPMANSH
jgi:hypothetical protein